MPEDEYMSGHGVCCKSVSMFAVLVQLLMLTDDHCCSLLITWWWWSVVRCICCVVVFGSCANTWACSTSCASCWSVWWNISCETRLCLWRRSQGPSDPWHRKRQVVVHLCSLICWDFIACCQIAKNQYSSLLYWVSAVWQQAVKSPQIELRLN